MEYISKSIEETAKIAADFLARLKKNKDGATLAGLYGELGSGKTTFMKYLAEKLGVEETIQSPTFVIMKKYKILAGGSFENLIHIDAYRIEREEEMNVLGWREIISDPKNLICIEWPEKIKGLLPGHIVVKFEHVSETERKIGIA